MARPKFEHPNADNTEAGRARRDARADELRALSRPPTDPSDDAAEEKPAGALPEPEKKKRTAPPAPTKRKR